MGLSEPLPLRHTARALNVMDSPYNAWGDNYHDDTGALLSALAAAKGNGGGALWFPHGTYLLGASLPVDGTLPIGFLGEGPAGYTGGGPQLVYTGSDWGVKSTATSYPAVNGMGAVTVVQDLSIQCLGSAYQGAVYANFLPVEFRGKVYTRGDPALTQRVGIGVQLTPANNQIDSRADHLWCGEFNWGMLLENDHFVADNLFLWDNYGQGLRIGQTGSSAAGRIGHLHVSNLAANPAPAVVLIQPSYLRIDVMHAEGAGVNNLFAFTAGAEGSLAIPRVGELEVNNLANGATLMSGQWCPIFEHVDSTFFAGAGFGVTTPAAPTQTGSNHAVQNQTGGRLMVYLDGTQVGTHVKDWLGTDKALPAASNLVVLDTGDSIYFATTCPSAWLWERMT